MNHRPVRPLLALTLLGLAAGCSSAPGTAPGSATGTDPTAVAPPVGVNAAPATEASRVQSYLDAQYLAADVRHSFHSAMGDDIDCVDFAHEPSVRALLAQGASVDELLAPFQRDEAKRRAQAEAAPGPHSAAYFEGERDEAGQARACPSGSVPHVRITPEQIAAAGGLDAYLGAFRKEAPTRETSPRFHAESTVPTGGGYQQDTGSYAWVQNWFSDTDALVVQGGTSTMTIAAPSLTPTSYGHSVAQVWLTGADKPNLERQTLEAGWIATPGATTGTQPPHLFIFTTSDAYIHGCFNGTTQSGCPTWVPNTSASLALNATLPASTAGGTQHELTITITHMPYLCFAEPCPGGYLGWIFDAAVDGGPSVYLGYYTNASYSAAGTSGLSQQADNFIVGGEVYDASQSFGAPPAVTMGEGSMTLGLASYGYTAYHRNFSYDSATYASVTTPSEVHYTNPEYIYNITEAAGSTAWTTYFYYGDWAPLRFIPIKL